MIYIYDILLNFKKELIEYFEWEDNDNIKYVKKIMLFKTDEKTIKDIIKNIVVLDNSFTKDIPKYEINNKKEDCNMCLLTDSKIVIGVLIENNRIEYISRMLLDEEYESLLESSSLPITNIKYKIIKKRNNTNNTLTRSESKIMKLLLVELDSLYKNHKEDALIYLYYEYTNKENKDIEYIYKYLKNSLKEFNNKHIHIYNILRKVKEK